MKPDVLEARVIAEPRDLTLRSAFADAVERRDPDRAALVRLQLTSYRHGGYSAAEDALLARSERWTRSVDRLVDGCTMAGGFVEGVRVRAARFLQVGEELRKLAPILDVQLLELAPVAAEVLASPLLAGLRSLDLRYGRLDDAAVTILAGNPHVGSLRWLDLSFNRIERPGLDAIAASPYLHELAWLGFANNPAPDPTPRVVAENGFVHFVEHPALGRELEEHHGPRTWLRTESDGPPRPQRFADGPGEQPPAR